MTHNPNIKRVLVVGGGLAGMAAAVALESAGLTVTLLEASNRLGGRAGSFRDAQSGEELDNCQHVLLGCCTNLLDFYQRIGSRDRIRLESSVHFRDGDGRGYDLWGLPLPAPLHMGPSMALFGALTLRQRISVGKAMIAMLRLGREGRAALANVPFGQWLDEHGQGAQLVERFYEPILISALNESCRLASARYCIQVFQDAMLANRRGYLLGLPSCSLGELYRRLPLRDVRLGWRVDQLRFEGQRVIGVRGINGESLDADAVVLAVSGQSAGRWLPEELARSDARFAGLDRLQPVPILGAHLWFDRPVMRRSHAALLAGPLQWLFRKDGEGRAVHGVISAAREWSGRDRQESLSLFEAQVRRMFPEAGDMKLVRGLIVIEKRATFAPLPGVDRLRPAQAPPQEGVQGLFLAGDYTRTGWPATMEGAVRGGYLAAEGVAEALLGERRRFLVDDLPVEWPARLMGL